MARSLFIVSLGALLLGACASEKGEIITDQMAPAFAQCTWNKDRVEEFSFESHDTLSNNEMYLIIRNNDDYPWANIYLFTEILTPTGGVMRDTLQYEMADKYGNWLGQGMSEVKENVLQIKKAFPLEQTGTYTVRVTQGMRDASLAGICNVGLKVVRKK